MAKERCFYGSIYNGVNMTDEVKQATDSLFGGPQKISGEDVEPDEETVEEVEEEEEPEEEPEEDDEDAGEPESEDPGTDQFTRLERNIQSINDRTANALEKVTSMVTDLSTRIENISSKNKFDMDSIGDADIITGEQLKNYHASIVKKEPEKPKQQTWKDPTEDAISNMPDINEVVAFGEKNNVKYPAHLADADIASKYYFIKSLMKKPAKKKKNKVPDIGGSQKANRPKRKGRQTQLSMFFNK
jgi:hypothetical protein